MKKKICFLTTVHITLRAFVLPLANYLHNTGDYDITFICNPDEQFEASLPEYIRFIPVPMERGVSIGGISAMLQMVKIFKREKFDLVQYSTPNAALYASLASVIAGVRHRKYHLMGFRFLGFDGVKRKIFSLIEKATCTLSTEIECVSPSNMRYGIDNGIFPKDKAGIVFHGSSAGVDLNRFDITQKPTWRATLREQLGYQDSDCVFAFAGRITGDKGLNELLAAFNRLDCEQAKLLMIGRIENEDTLDPKLMEMARNNPRVKFLSFVADIERYYAMMDVLVLPSYREGFGNIIIEAEAMGVPVIVSDIPGPIDAMIPNKTGLTVPVKDAEALVRAMKTLAVDDELRYEYGQAGHDFVEISFSQTKVLENTEIKLRACLVN